MFIRQFDGSIGASGVRGNVGRKTSRVGCGGTACLKVSCVAACMIVSLKQKKSMKIS